MENINSIEKDVFAEKAITIDLIKELWSKTYNTEGKPDWSHILPYYDINIYFRDSIQGIHGIKEFTATSTILRQYIFIGREFGLFLLNSLLNVGSLSKYLSKYL